LALEVFNDGKGNDGDKESDEDESKEVPDHIEQTDQGKPADRAAIGAEKLLNTQGHRSLQGSLVQA
jgi:hypothetical protein